MPPFDLHDADSAPGKSPELLRAVGEKYGFTPNLFRILAESPAALEGYLSLSQIFGASSLTPLEQQTVLLTASFENECDYCMAAHSTVAEMSGAPGEILAALRSGAPLPDPRLEALRRFTAAVVQRRGWVSESDVAAFLEAGFSRGQMLEVILGVALKTLSNYTNHLARTPVDAAFEKHAWTPPEKSTD